MCARQNSNIDRPMTEADVKRIVAAAVKASGPTAGGGGDTEAKHKLKAEEHKKHGRLPEGKRCKAGRAVRWCMPSTMEGGKGRDGGGMGAQQDYGGGYGLRN